MDWCGPNPRKCNVPPGGGNSANQTDRYIAKGGAAEEVFTPHFTYHGHSNRMFFSLQMLSLHFTSVVLSTGYRYVQLEGLPYKPTADTLTGHFVHTNVTKDGHVAFKNESMSILNGIQKAIVYTQMSNYYHHPTDCPQRVRAT